MAAQACGGAAAMKSADTAPGAPMTSPAVAAEAAPPADVQASGMAVAAQDAPAPAPPPPAQGQPGSAPGPTAPAEPATADDRKVLAEARKMVDIEARLSIEVKEVQRAAGELRALVAKSGGQMISDTVTANEGSARADLALRVPAEGANDFFAAVERIGIVRNRQVTTKDIGKEFYDATIRLANLEVVRKRYEEILTQAKTIEEILRLEGELSRIRQQIEQLKGEIRWMRDRAARATIYVSLYTESTAPPQVILEPEAKLYPGVRFSYLHDFRGDDGDEGYLGAGISLGATPQVSLELQGFREVGSDTAGLDGFFVTLNGRIYSEFLGDGHREFLNPYIGLRGGYARFLGKNEALLGGLLGLELVKGEWYIIDAEVRASALFGSDAGGHVGVEPSLGASIAF
ncbi:MAG TPA: DUF4349 domain-containing protein [Polyangiaceae bacterium]|nr:DUF4349 domain-containing protein [Polyangiaceae bacterium]